MTSYRDSGSLGELSLCYFRYKLFNTDFQALEMKNMRTTLHYFNKPINNLQFFQT